MNFNDEMNIPADAEVSDGVLYVRWLDDVVTRVDLGSVIDAPGLAYLSDERWAQRVVVHQDGCVAWPTPLDVDWPTYADVDPVWLRRISEKTDVWPDDNLSVDDKARRLAAMSPVEAV